VRGLDLISATSGFRWALSAAVMQERGFAQKEQFIWKEGKQ